MTRDEIIYNALVEYENNHYESENDKWQETINDLIKEYKEKGEQK